MRQINDKKINRSGAESVKIMQVIQIVINRGIGTEYNPNRYVTEYWSMEGEKLMTIDPICQEDIPDFDIPVWSEASCEKD